MPSFSPFFFADAAEGASGEPFSSVKPRSRERARPCDRAHSSPRSARTARYRPSSGSRAW